MKWLDLRNELLCHGEVVLPCEKGHVCADGLVCKADRIAQFAGQRAELHRGVQTHIDDLNAHRDGCNEYAAAHLNLFARFIDSPRLSHVVHSDQIFLGVLQCLESNIRRTAHNQEGASQFCIEMSRSDAVRSSNVVCDSMPSVCNIQFFLD